MNSLVETCRDAGISLYAAGLRWDVVLDTPDRLNSQTPATWRALTAIGRAVRDADERGVGPRVIVLTGAGASFSAGLDRGFMVGGLSEAMRGEPGLVELAGLDDDRLDETIAGFQQAFTWWRECQAITIAAVQGHAIGAGFQLALACDLRLVADDVSFAMKETSLGLVPDLGGIGILVEVVGYARALGICLTGRPVHADEAVVSGIALASVPVARLSESVEQFVARLFAPPSGAVRATKELVAGALHLSTADQLAEQRRAQSERLRYLVRHRGTLAELAGLPSRGGAPSDDTTSDDTQRDDAQSQDGQSQDGQSQDGQSRGAPGDDARSGISSIGNSLSVQ